VLSGVGGGSCWSIEGRCADLTTLLSDKTWRHFSRRVRLMEILIARSVVQPAYEHGSTTESTDSLVWSGASIRMHVTHLAESDGTHACHRANESKGR
jgi:hypothetical protein